MKKSVTLLIALLSIFGALVSVAETEVLNELPVFSEADVDKKPVPLIRSAPVYPKKEKRNRVQASVNIEFVVDSGGNVNSPNVLEFTLDHPKTFKTEEAYEAARKAFTDSATTSIVLWKYEPGRKDGKAVDTRVEFPLSYTLRR